VQASPVPLHPALRGFIENVNCFHSEEHLTMVCERPPACRFAPRLSPFVRGTLSNVPLTKGDSRGAKRQAGGRSHTMRRRAS
jgi:hypothetical protein